MTNWGAKGLRKKKEIRFRVWWKLKEWVDEQGIDSDTFNLLKFCGDKRKKRNKIVMREAPDFF